MSFTRDNGRNIWGSASDHQKNLPKFGENLRFFPPILEARRSGQIFTPETYINLKKILKS